MLLGLISYEERRWLSREHITGNFLEKGGKLSKIFPSKIIEIVLFGDGTIGLRGGILESIPDKREVNIKPGG